MNRRLPGVLVLAFVTLAAGVPPGCSAPPRAGSPSLSDPSPGFLEQYALTNRFRCGRPGSFSVTPDGSRVMFLRSGPRDRVQQLYEFDTRTAHERVLLTAPQLLGAGEERLSPEEQARRERARQTARGITSFQLSKDGRTILVPLSGRLFVADADGANVRELKPSVADAPAPLDPRLSPDASRVAMVRGGELWVIDVSTGRETRLTSGATDTLSHGDAEFIAQEELGRSQGYWWSPDSQKIVYQRTDTSKVEQVFIADPLHPFTPPQSWRYPRAGTPNADVTLWVVPASGGEPTSLPWDRAEYPYLGSVKWEKQHSLFVVVQNRAQSESRLIRYDTASWTPSLVLTETDPAWVNLDQQMPAFDDALPGFLWTTDSAGWTDLQWRMDSSRGSQRRLVVGGDINYRSLVKVDPSRRETLFIAGPDPTQSHLYSVRSDRGEGTPECLTCATPGQHSAVVSKDGSILVLSRSPELGEPTARVYRRDPGERGLGMPVGEIRSEAESPGFIPRVEWTTVTGAATWHAAVIRPRGFRAGVRLPVICSVYAGPTAQTVTRHAHSYLLQQWIADHGFIVVSIDNRGTPGRGRNWERLAHGDLIGLQLSDQCEALRLLCAKYPEMDADRIGVYGWSFGGYFSAMAACRRPDVYKAACAGAPVIDWADYDTAYTERYLGLPEANAGVYADANVLNHVAGLRTPMLLIHGTADDNVYFTHSLRFMDAALRAGVSRWVRFMPLPGQTHVVTDPGVVEAMYSGLVRFFVETLSDGQGRGGTHGTIPTCDTATQSQ